MRERGGKYIDPQKAFVVHEDQGRWIQNYRGKETPIQDLFREREEKLKNGEPIHNPDHDEEMKETAEERNHIVKGGDRHE